MKAIWNDVVLADSDDTVEVEGRHYFPLDSVAAGCLADSEHRTHCSWKGTAHYFHVLADGQTNPDAAWCYPEPLPEAAHVGGRVAFWKGVHVGP